MKIAVLTSVHPRTDTRIRVKQVPAIAKINEAQVRLYVMDDQGDEEAIGFKIKDVGQPPRSRIARALLGNWRMWRACRRWKADIAHFHDPELIVAGVLLKLAGTKVIYDVHEDVPRQILSKHWIPPLFRKIVATFIGALERLAGRYFDRIIAATPTIAARFDSNKALAIRNFPKLEEMKVEVSTPYRSRKNSFVYVGRVSLARGLLEMVRAVERAEDTEARLELAGPFGSDEEYELGTVELGWARVNVLGQVDRRQVAELLASGKAGLAIYHPTPSYLDAYPVKLFEYMAAGLPVIASNFPLYGSFLKDPVCGILVDPTNVDEISAAMNWMLSHPIEAEQMGINGKKVVSEMYNWQREEQRLIQFYVGICSN